MYLPNTKWTWSFFLAALAQGIIALSLEAYVFGKYQTGQRINVPPDVPETRTIPTYLAVFMFGFIYEILLVWDALRMKNTIQVIGIVLYNAGILLYAGIQYDQIDDAIKELDRKLFFDHPAFWFEIKPMLIALPILMGVFTFIFAFIAWRLYDEFAWSIYKHISADLRMKRRYLNYQIYIALLKFDFFFFLAFTIQFLVVVDNTTEVEQGLTAAALVVTFCLLFAAAWWVRRESIVGMIIIIVVYFIALAYFLFKLIRMYITDEARQKDYMPARKSLTSFAVLTIALLLVTIVIACICTHNFNKGLKQHLNEKKGDRNKNGAVEMPYVSGPSSGQRMEID
ncbi:hypothetical protein M011DRAFT_395019 [Sporormia fimetaria CBS 119925]|uniref:Uncharacterized protein n=1 Tax=Sporormia fimetaria CBS 119925 TaxID=1340428 RepID=A0A6A6VLX0_9PLEO|nr:hypothetical protein M011DRAFT_395019 [Sporormia fimetaria CBS 119925]